MIISALRASIVLGECVPRPDGRGYYIPALRASSPCLCQAQSHKYFSLYSTPISPKELDELIIKTSLGVMAMLVPNFSPLPLGEVG